MNDLLTKTHAIAAFIALLALLVSAIAPGHDVALVAFVSALPLLASLTALTLQGGKWHPNLLPVVILEIAVLVVIPSLYIHARIQSDSARIVDLANQSRIGEARSLAHQVLALWPNATWKGNSIQLAAENLDRAASQIEERVKNPLAPDASLQQHLARARDLAMLGRTKEALQTLDAAPGSDDSPDASNLRGTIHETRGEWQTALQWYQRAQASFRRGLESRQKDAQLMRAMTGIAFCQRKLGRLPEAETAWKRRLQRFPTAESHFLLAQFYEDTQQAQKARLHAAEAIRLDPERYAQQGRRLMDKLVTSHFGCLGVFRAASSPSTPFGASTIDDQ